MGMGIPTVFPKRVTQVWVQYWILAHCAHRVPIPRCHGYSQVNYVIMVSPFIIILISILMFYLPLEGAKKRSEFETLTNVTNRRVWFHPTSHSINNRHQAFGPLPMGLREE